MSITEEAEENSDDGRRFSRVKRRLKDRSKKVAQTKEKTKEILSKQAVLIAKHAEEHESFLTKVTHFLGVFAYGAFCFILGARPQDVRYIYVRWTYYRYKKWHYYLFDFCYYANTIFLIMLLFFPRNQKLFMVTFSFAEGPLACALIVWRCSLVFSSVDKLVSVLIHLLPGVVFFTICWRDPEGAPGFSWRDIENRSFLCTWLFTVPLIVYVLWQVLYFLIVNVLRGQRLLKDPEVMTSYRGLSKKAQKANNVWWRLRGCLGDQNRKLMYILLQAVFTVATMALTVPIFMSSELHLVFQILKVSAAVWNGGQFLVEVMPRQVVLKQKKKLELPPAVISVESNPCLLS
ncbi:glycerophosphocholine acyltransferase 1-like [Bidens hawaiensis]|uniref:glycerophosphocholine acyltransferase 1-like n=1 Tax=Bidens hawaiensis TaxID=980011 RepID=UPI004049025D